MIPNFSVINAKITGDWLADNLVRLPEIMEFCYRQNKLGAVENPDSYFLRFKNEPGNRIIALPAALNVEMRCAGLKWISSFPKNIDNNLNRASSVFILNDRETGYPIACIEGSQISACRTAAVALLGATHLHPTVKYIAKLAIVGTGLIAYECLRAFRAAGWKIDEILLVDKQLDRAHYFARKSEIQKYSVKVSVDDIAIERPDMILFATSAIEPFVLDNTLFEHCPTVLHLSLRDIHPEIIINCHNICDDVDHAVKANTSLHLAEQQLGNRTFIDGDLIDVIDGTVKLSTTKPRVFSPFGMGILDLAVAKFMYDDVNSVAISVDNFNPDPY